MPHHKKILKLEELSHLLDKERLKHKRIVLCHGVFDLLHPGHIRHFAEASQQGDLLVVTLTKDQHVNKGPGRPAFTEQLRAESIAALGDVDYVAINETPTAVEAIRALKPDVYVKGQDYEERSGDLTQGIYAEEKAVTDNGGTIHFTHDITFSSTNILNSHFGVYPEKARQFLSSFKEKSPADSIIEQLKDLKNLKVLLIGDTIVDEYHYCQPLGKSPKETIVSTRYLSEEAFPGGILACANHIASFSDHVHLVTCLGAKDTKQSLIEAQLNSKITTRFFVRDDACTVVKRRYVEPAFLTKMFQISFLTDTDLPEPLSNEVVRYLREALPQYDLVVVADYGHGFLSRAIRDVICERSPFLALNVQTNSANLGYNLVTKYPKADYICIDEPELRLAMQQKYSPIHDLISEFSRRYSGGTITITRGHNGSITARPTEGKADGYSYFEAPSVSSKIVDRVGAGDAYLAVSSMLACQRAEPEVIGFVGNAVGAMAVEVVCNRTSMQAVPLYKFIKALLA
jgi:rfaE bifunctional protein nucleotidyltransferase chain/domain